MSTTFKLATIQRQEGDGTAVDGDIAALVVEGRLFPLDDLAPDRPELQAGCSGCSSAGTTSIRRSGRWPSTSTATRVGLAPDDRSIRVLTPIRYPRAVFCTVFNYYDFAAEAGVTPPDKSAARPYVCIKLPHSVIGPNETIVAAATPAATSTGSASSAR